MNVFIEIVKIVLFIAGFKKSPADHAVVIAAIEKKGYEVRPIWIDWDDDTTIDDWLRQARAEYEKYKPQDVILAGHSFGAIIAFILAATRSPFALWLFSLSGRFAEDIPKMTAKKKAFLGNKIMEAFARIRFDAFVSKILCPTLLFFGSEERTLYPELVARVEEAYRRLGTKAKLVEIEGAKHKLNDPLYVKAITDSI